MASFIPRRLISLSPAFASPFSVHYASFNTSKRPLSSLSLRHFAPKTKHYKNPRSLLAPPGSPTPKNIAVIGGGLAGLAVTYHLLHSTARIARKRDFPHTDIRVTVFDPCPAGTGGASAAAAGLLHCFTPRVKKKIWMSRKGIDAAFNLLNIAEQFSSVPIVRKPGLLRIALTDTMVEDFKSAARRFPHDIEYLEADEVVSRFPAATSAPGVFIKRAAVVDTSGYLAALWEACNQTGRAKWSLDPVHSISSLLQEPTFQCDVSSDPQQFDTVVLCAGAAIKSFSEFHDFPLRPCRGQNLVMESLDIEELTDVENVHSGKEIDVPIISGKYVVPAYFATDDSSSKGKNGTARRIIAGATFEYRKEDQSEAQFLKELGKKDMDRAISELSDPLHKLVPQLYNQWNVVDTSSGTRALPPRSEDGSIPIVCRVNGAFTDSSCWAFTGLGSRGLLHHAYLGRMLAHAIAAGNDELIPLKARRCEINTRKME